MSEPKFPHIKVRLSVSDGNAFSIMGKVTRAMKQAKVPAEIIKQYTDKSMGGDYNNLLQTAMDYVDVT